MVQKAVQETRRTCVETERKPKEEECFDFLDSFKSFSSVSIIDLSYCELGRVCCYLMAKDIRSEGTEKNIPIILDLFPT